MAMDLESMSSFAELDSREFYSNFELDDVFECKQWNYVRTLKYRCVHPMDEYWKDKPEPGRQDQHFSKLSLFYSAYL